MFVTGMTFGALPGLSTAGGGDAFLRKYSSNGDEGWTRQLGSTFNDESSGVAADRDGNVSVVGFTSGVLSGQVSEGGIDAFISKYDSDGAELWARQLGTDATDVALDVAVDSEGDVYIVGLTFDTLSFLANSGMSDAFLRRYD